MQFAPDEEMMGYEERYWRRLHENTRHDLKAVCYPEHTVAFNRYLSRFQEYALARALRSQAVNLSGKRVLDIGTGRGRWLDFYSRYGASACIGIDLSLDALVLGGEHRSTAGMVQASATELPFRRDTFDLVNSVTVLMHVPHDCTPGATRYGARARTDSWLRASAAQA